MIRKGKKKCTYNPHVVYTMGLFSQFYSLLVIASYVLDLFQKTNTAWISYKCCYVATEVTYLVSLLVRLR